jgi:hypothetical protein
MDRSESQKRQSGAPRRPGEKMRAVHPIAGNEEHQHIESRDRAAERGESICPEDHTGKAYCGDLARCRIDALFETIWGDRG